MDIYASLAKFGLLPRKEDCESIRDLLREEIEKERNGARRSPDLALLCCVQLFAAATPEDIELIWSAKTSGWDLDAYLDGRLVLVLGLEETKSYLSSRKTMESAKALDYIEAMEATGQLAGFSRENTISDYRRYFRLA